MVKHKHVHTHKSRYVKIDEHPSTYVVVLVLCLVKVVVLLRKTVGRYWCGWEEEGRGTVEE